jgi:hypothetical protein
LLRALPVLNAQADFRRNLPSRYWALPTISSTVLGECFAIGRHLPAWTFLDVDVTFCSPWIHVAEWTAEAQAIKRTIDEEDAKHMAGGRNIVADMHDVC